MPRTSLQVTAETTINENAKASCQPQQRSRFFLGEFGRNVLVLMTGTTIAQVIPLAISPLLTRIYTPNDFGAFSLYLAIASTIAVVATGRYELAIILPSRNSSAEQLVFLGTAIAFVISVLTFCVFLTGSVILNTPSIYLTIALFVFVISVGNILDKYNNRLKHYKIMSLQRIAKSSVESIVSLASGALLLKQGLIYGSVLGYAASFFCMLGFNYTSMTTALRKTSRNKLGILANKYMNFPKYNLPHAMLNTVAVNAPVFLIPIFFGSATLGYYSFGLKVVQAPLSLISMSVYNVFSQRLAELRAKGEDAKPLFMKTLRTVAIMTLCISPFFCFAGDLFAFAFGSRWRDAGVYLHILAPSVLVGFLVACFASIPLIYGNQKRALLIEIAAGFVQIVPLIVGVHFFSLDIKAVLAITTVLYSCLLLYSLSWFFSIVKGQR